ncbi:uncharacterized protein LOC126265640 [Aethina tumida]|uniref:uncharacterized protein LOC126265640 n=1 Tax=Aethina tumida TaxID=116153 RepID=UPI002147EBF0|nr:uncharacterized protein LOC126265640 [Aethina tumida]XP_049823671.1 uncharacterized protein LOC126265640 [Aethina tumida]
MGDMEPTIDEVDKNSNNPTATLDLEQSVDSGKDAESLSKERFIEVTTSPQKVTEKFCSESCSEFSKCLKRFQKEKPINIKQNRRRFFEVIDEEAKRRTNHLKCAAKGVDMFEQFRYYRFLFLKKRRDTKMQRVAKNEHIVDEQESSLPPVVDELVQVNKTHKVAKPSAGTSTNTSLLKVKKSKNNKTKLNQDTNENDDASALKEKTEKIKDKNKNKKVNNSSSTDASVKSNENIKNKKVKKRNLRLQSRKNCSVICESKESNNEPNDNIPIKKPEPTKNVVQQRSVAQVVARREENLETFFQRPPPDNWWNLCSDSESDVEKPNEYNAILATSTNQKNNGQQVNLEPLIEETIFDQQYNEMSDTSDGGDDFNEPELDIESTEPQLIGEDMWMKIKTRKRTAKHRPELVNTNFQFTEDDLLAMKIHGILSDSEESETGKNDFDELYYKYRPPPIQIDRSKIVVIKAKIENRPLELSAN